MERDNSKVRLFTYILSIVMLAFSANVNFDVIRHYFTQATVVYNYSDFIFVDRSWSAIIATIILLFTYHKFTARKIVIFISMVYIFAQVNIIVSNNENMVRFYYFLLMLSSTALFVFLLSLILVETRVKDEMNIAIFFSTLILGFLFSEFVNHHLLSVINNKTLNRVVGLNILPIVILICAFVLSNSFSVSRRKQFPDFVVVLKFAELEAMIIFSIFFILMILYEERDILERKHSISYFMKDAVWYYFCIAILILIYPVTYITKRIAVHQLNLICLFFLLVSFSSMRLWVSHYVFGFTIWVFIALTIYLLFISNIMKVLEKFRRSEAFGALILIFFIGSVGLYVGHVSAYSFDQMHSLPTPVHKVSNFLISIVIGTVFVYYLFRFIKDNMYNVQSK